jgi:hypothetical protein
MEGAFEGKVFPRKVFRSETGEEDPTKLYLMARGKFAVMETDEDKGTVDNKGGDIYIRGWLTREHHLFGEVTITYDEREFETFKWKTLRQKPSLLKSLFNK